MAQLMALYMLLLFCLHLTSSKPAVVEGDLVIDKRLAKIRQQKQHPDVRQRRSLRRGTHEHRWKYGFVPYVISTALDDNMRELIKEAFQHIEKYSCIQFSPRKKERDYVEFIEDEGCYSSVGRQNGRQSISLGRGCNARGTVIHEILHTLGMFHEQTRLDRELYVHVLWWNVQRGAEGNFATYDHGVIDAMNFPYDYNSVTHYHNTEFTKNGHETLQANDKPERRLGSQSGMSKIDMKKIWYFYKCYNKKLRRPKKAECKDRYWFCHKYTGHCTVNWFAEWYCPKMCKTCVST